LILLLLLSLLSRRNCKTCDAKLCNRALMVFSSWYSLTESAWKYSRSSSFFAIFSNFPCQMGSVLGRRCKSKCKTNFKIFLRILVSLCPLCQLVDLTEGTVDCNWGSSLAETSDAGDSAGIEETDKILTVVEEVSPG
jgi:hypothetical protein